MTTIEPAKSEVPRSHARTKPNTWIRFLRRWLFRFIGLFVLFIILFALAAWILGNVPINQEFTHAEEDGIDILLINNGVHVDLVLPIHEKEFSWMDYLMPLDFPAFNERYQYAAFGWGNRQFYMETQTWDDLKISNVLFAFAGLGETVVHVELLEDMDWQETKSRKIRLSPNQFNRLCQFVSKTFKHNAEGSLVPIPNAHYHHRDAFYEATGQYHLFRTCNVWIGSALAHSGVRVGYWTLTPDLLFACLPSPP
jgi:uncharacterized protein (TIGR02117 family)